MIKIIIIIIAISLIVALAIYFNKKAGKTGDEYKREYVVDESVSAQDYKQMYLIGISTKMASEIGISQGQITALMTMVNVKWGVVSCAAIDPLYLINEKGTTAWLAMYFSAYVNDLSYLKSYGSKDGYLFIPSGLITGTFKGHNNWPISIQSKYDLKLPGYNLFCIPFLVHKNFTDFKNLPHSLKSPDGGMEIFNINEFNDKEPEVLLQNYESIIKFIKDNRPDIYRKN